MNEIIQTLRVAGRPFVTRALRGPRLRRFALASGLLALLVVLGGAWVGLSPGPAARDARVSLDLEEYRWDRERTEFTLFVDSPVERDMMLAEAELWHSNPATNSEFRHLAEEAWTLLDMVSGPQVVPPNRYRSLQQQARDLRDARRDLAPRDLDRRHHYTQFNWNRAQDLERLQAILDAQLEPRVVLYHSPLDGAETIRLVGVMAGGLLLLLWTVCAPLWVGVRLAQELHENTLQPLTGTALTARQLVLGLIVGPLSPLAIITAPLLVVTLGAAAGAGRLVPTLGFLVTMLAMAAMLIGLAMLGALAVGRKRAPGIVGIGLLALFGLAAMAGVGAGLNLHRDTLGLVTIVPGAGPVHLLSEAFNPVALLHAHQAQALDVRVGLATLGGILLAVIAWRAIERWVGGTHRDGALTPVEAGIAALMLSILAMAAMPQRHIEFGETLFAGMAIVLVPLQLVLMGRVPGGDIPPRLRTVPTVRLVREYFGWLGLTVLVALAFGGAPEDIRAGLPLGLMHLAWALTVIALVTIRAAALPTSIPVKLWLCVCVGFALLEYGTAAIWCMESPDGELLFPLAAASPALGLLHVGMFLWIPISLVRGLTPKDRPALDLHAREDAAPLEP